MTSIQRFNATVDIVNRVKERFEQIQKGSKEWDNPVDWQGSEDYSDAISYIGDLFQAVAAEMLYEVYRDNPMGFSNEAEVIEQLKKRLDEANEDAEHALEQLSLFQLTAPTLDQI